MGLYLMTFGGLALFAWIYVSWVAIRLLESVNYFQHFGLTSESEQSGETAWHCNSAVSLFMFLGLTRHADHHRRPGVAFTELNEVAGGLNLPFGYLVMAIWVKNSCGSFRRWAIKEMTQQAEAVRPCPEAANAKALRS
jgi:alkane 1-monooxygenase